MRRIQTVICATVIVATPMTADAHWSTYRGGHHHSGAYRSSGLSPRRISYGSRLAGPPRAICGIFLRDSRGRLTRCSAARAAFERDNPCPATGLSQGPCPGYVVDHIVPLKRGGLDDPSNMQWQTTEEARAKDKVE